MLNRQMRPVYSTDADQAPARRLLRLNAVDEKAPASQNDEDANDETSVSHRGDMNVNVSNQADGIDHGSDLNISSNSVEQSTESNVEEANESLNAEINLGSHEQNITESPTDEESSSLSAQNDQIATSAPIESNESNVQNLQANLSDEQNEKSSVSSETQSVTAEDVILPKVVVDTNSVASTNITSSDQSGDINVNSAILLAKSQTSSKGPPAKRTRGPKTVKIDRRPILRLISGNTTEVVARHSSRIHVPVAQYNYGFVRCSVCGKSFYQDIAIEHYDGNIACSFECLKK